MRFVKSNLIAVPEEFCMGMMEQVTAILPWKMTWVLPDMTWKALVMGTLLPDMI
jgi:hypothetical protein